MAEIRIGISGAGGRMGRMLVAEVRQTPGCVLAGGIEYVASPLLGQDIGALAGSGGVGLALSDADDELFNRSAVVIDSSTPEASLTHAKLAAAAKKALVIGTTGFDTT